MVFIAPKSEDAGKNVEALGVVGSTVSMMAVWKNLRCTATACRSHPTVATVGNHLSSSCRQLSTLSPTHHRYYTDQHT
jgi:hypothetical protein